MTSTELQMRRQAVAVRRGAELAQALDPLNEPLRHAVDEPLPSDVYVLAEVAVALGQVCLQQREHITELASRVEELEARLPVESGAKK
jgi:hypothetical protein